MVTPENPDIFFFAILVTACECEVLCVRLRSPCDPECGSGEGKWTDMISPFSNMLGSESNETSEGASVCVSSVSLPSQSEFFSLQFVAFIAHFFTRYDDHPSYLEGFESWFDRAAACMRQTPRKVHGFASKISKKKIKFNLVFSISCKKKNNPKLQFSTCKNMFCCTFRAPSPL